MHFFLPRSHLKKTLLVLSQAGLTLLMFNLLTSCGNKSAATRDASSAAEQDTGPTVPMPAEACPHYKPVQKRIAIVSLEAMGAVLRSTCLLPAIQRKYPEAHITWVTLPVCKPLLDQNPYIHRIITVEANTIHVLQHLQFDVLFAVDKSLEAGALAERLHAKEKFGFGLTPGGAIRPFNEEAGYQFDVGLSDQLKFFDNQKAETQQITETMALPWVRDPYVLKLTAEEKDESGRRRQLLLGAGSKAAKGVIGYNTGCSPLYPYKKFTVPRAVETIAMWRKSFPDHVVALLGGGPDDELRQKQMKEAFANDAMVVSTPTLSGLRSGILWVDAHL